MRVKKVAVKDKNGVIQVAEIGGGGGAAPELEQIKVDASAAHVYPGDRTLTWDEVTALTPNTGVAPAAAEKEMYRDDDGGYTRERIVYDGYMSKTIAEGDTPSQIDVYAKGKTSKVTIYDLDWAKVVDSEEPGHTAATYFMNNYWYDMFGDETLAVRAGMDDMDVAWAGEDMNAQQRVYIDVEDEYGAKSYYVLVLRIPKQTGRSIKGNTLYISPDTLWAKRNGNVVGPFLSEVSLWSDADENDMTNRARATVAKYGTVDENGERYPLAFKAKLPYCEAFRIQFETEDPLSDAAIGTSGLGDYSEGGLDQVFDTDVMVGSGQTLHLIGAVRSQRESLSDSQADGRYFEINIEFYVPKYMKTMLRSLGVLAPEVEEPMEPEEPTQ